MKRTQADLALAGITIVWGTTFVIVKSALNDVSPFLFLTLRFCLATFALCLIYRGTLQKFKKSFLLPGLLAGCLLFAAYVFQTIGLELTTPSKSAFLTGLSIPLVPLASSLVYRDRPRLREVSGILIASFGMILMTLPSSWSASSGFAMERGDFLSVLCAVTFALHIVVIGHYSPIIGFAPLAVAQIGTAAALGLFSVWFAEPVRFSATPGVAVAVLLTGLMATALAFTTQAWAQQYTSASRAALIFALEPVIAWTTSWILTGETISGRGMAGAGLILAGILVVELKRSKEPGHQNKRGRLFDTIQSKRGT
jgi:drug/metabolite transporter (DMT)-like permease